MPMPPIISFRCFLYVYAMPLTIIVYFRRHQPLYYAADYFTLAAIFHLYYLRLVILMRHLFFFVALPLCFSP